MMRATLWPTATCASSAATAAHVDSRDHERAGASYECSTAMQGTPRTERATSATYRVPVRGVGKQRCTTCGRTCLRMRRYARSACTLRQPAIGGVTMVDAVGRSAAIHDAVSWFGATTVTST